MNEQNWIDFTSLPHGSEGFSNLYCDYLAQFQKVEKYYSADFHNLQNFRPVAEKVLQKFNKRAEITTILESQNKSFGASEKTFENIRKLTESNTLTIVTGQQVGVLCGPLYTLYKTITAVKLAEQLGTAFPEYNFVPVFWLEGEDHDFQEMNHTGLLNLENKPTHIEYLLGGVPMEKNIGAIGEVTFDEHINTFFKLLESTLQPTEFRQPLIELLSGCYAPGKSFTAAFAAMMNKLLPDAGLIFLSSNDKQVKQLLKHILIKEINEFPQSSQKIIQQSVKLEENYHAQIKPKALNLFCFHKGGRYLIEPREHDFSLKGIRQYYSKEELVKIADETPEFFSPNVALRPICQDTLLPTLAYVAGPSEIAYFAQLKPVYEYFGVSMPVIYPRASATIFEQKHFSIVQKYGMNIETFFNEIDKVTAGVLESLSDVRVDDLFGQALQRLSDLANEMSFGLETIDPTLLGALENTRLKIEEHLMVLKTKTTEAQIKKHEIVLRQIGKVVNCAYPEGTFQERFINIAYYMNKYGLDFVQKLNNEIVIDKFKHQVIPLG